MHALGVVVRVGRVVTVDKNQADRFDNHGAMSEITIFCRHETGHSER